MNFLKKNGLTLLSLVLSVVLLGVVLEQSRTIGDLQNQMSNQYQYLDNSVRNISGQVTYAMEEATRVVADADFTSAGLDRENDALLLDVSVTLRSFAPDTTVTLALSSDTGEERLLPLTAGNGGVYTARISLPLSDSGRDFSTQALVTTAGVTAREELYTRDLASLLPIQCSSWNSGRPAEVEDGGRLRLFEEWSVSLDVAPDTDVHAPEFRLYRNDHLVQTKAASGALAEGEWAPEGTYYAGAWDSEDCAEGDSFALRFACGDDAGLSYEFTLQRWEIQDGFAVESAPLVSEIYPKLS